MTGNMLSPPTQPRFVSASGPRLIAVPTTRQRRSTAQPNPLAKNLIILKAGMGFPIGAVVESEAFPNGFQGHLEMGAVEWSPREATHKTNLTAKPKTDAETTADNSRLRSLVADLESQLARWMSSSERKDQEIMRLNNELKETDRLLREATEALHMQKIGDHSAAMAAGPTPVLPSNPTPANPMSGLPVMHAPWKNDFVEVPAEAKPEEKAK